MTNTFTNPVRMVAGSLGAMLLLALAVACSKPTTSATPGTKGGSQLWAENCASCHNAHPSTYYSSAQWPVVSQHMRLIANLTGEDSRKIELFLKGGK